MPKPFKNEVSTKYADKEVSNAAAEKKINEVANEAAKESTKTEQHYDEKHGIISK